MEERLEAAHMDQKRLFLIVFQRFIMILSEHLVRCDTDARDHDTHWYRNTIQRLRQVFLVVSGVVCFLFVFLSTSGIICGRIDNRCGKKVLEWSPRTDRCSVGQQESDKDNIGSGIEKIDYKSFIRFC